MDTVARPKLLLSEKRMRLNGCKRSFGLLIEHIARGVEIVDADRSLRQIMRRGQL